MSIESAGAPPGDGPPPTPGDPHPASASAGTYLDVANSADFERLRRSLRRFVFPMTAAFLAWYGLYVLLSAYARDFMGARVVGNVNIALIFGLLQFVSTFLIAWLYARYADRQLDPLATQIRHRLESAGAGTGRAPAATGADREVGA